MIICRQHKKATFEVIFIELIGESSSRTALQADNIKACNFLLKKKLLRNDFRTS